MLDYDGDDLEDVFCLSFVISREVFGSVQTDELKPGGANITVTQKNKYDSFENERYSGFFYKLLNFFFFQARICRFVRGFCLKQVYCEAL